MDSAVHTCSYSCERPECIKAQRDELAARLEAQRDQASGNAEYLAYLEAAVDDAGFVIKHDGGTLGNSNFRLEPKTQPAAAQEAVAYLDIGAGGYLDIGSDLPEEQLLALPKGRHALGIIGTYGIDGYVSAPVAAAPDYIAVRVEGIGTAHLRLVDGGVDIPAMTIQHMAMHLSGDTAPVAEAPVDALEATARRMFEQQADPLAAPWERQWEPTKEHWRKIAAKASTPAAPGIGLQAFRKVAMPILCQMLCSRDAESVARKLHAALIDASPKGDDVVGG